MMVGKTKWIEEELSNSEFKTIQLKNVNISFEN